MSNANPYETEARARKATELFLTARARKIPAVEVANLTNIRTMLVTVTGVREASEETWRMVVAMLDQAARIDRIPTGIRYGTTVKVPADPNGRVAKVTSRPEDHSQGRVRIDWSEPFTGQHRWGFYDADKLEVALTGDWMNQA